MIELHAYAEPPDPADAALQVAVLRIVERTVFDALTVSGGAPEAFPQALHDALWNRIDELDTGL